MEVKTRIVKEYLTTEGRNPFRSWLEDLKDIKAQCIIDAKIINIRRGNFGNYKAIGNGVMEFKIDYGPGYRIYFGFDGNVLVILLCGGTKKTQDKDIRKSHEFWDDYKGRD